MATPKKDKDEPVAEPKVDEAQLGESLRHLELMARGFAAVHEAVKNYHVLRQGISSLERQRAALEAEHTKLVEESANIEQRQFDAIKRYEKERAVKDAQEKAAHDRMKEGLRDEMTKMTESLQSAQERLDAALARAREAEQATEQRLVELDDSIAVRKSEVAQEIERLELPMKQRYAEYQEITDALESLKRKHGIAPAIS